MSLIKLKIIDVSDLKHKRPHLKEIKFLTVFPETGEEDLKDVFGLQLTIVTTAKTKKEAAAYLTHLGFPFKKVIEKSK